MALRDLREYYFTLLAQQQEMEADLNDFNEALKNGYITEDRLAEVKDEVERIKVNRDRVAWCLYLLEKPNKPAKKPKYDKANKALLQNFQDNKADTDSVIAENKSALDHIRVELKKLKESK